jgi:hypothetical protein
MEKRESFKRILTEWHLEFERKIPTYSEGRINAYLYLFKNLIEQAGMDIQSIEGEKRKIIEVSIWGHTKQKKYPKDKLANWKELAEKDFEAAIHMQDPVTLIMHNPEDYKTPEAKQLAIAKTSPIKVKEPEIDFDSLGKVPLTDEIKKTLPYIEQEFDIEEMERLGVKVNFNE